MPDVESLRLEDRIALRSAAAHLQNDFDGLFDRETIENCLYSSYDDMKPRASVNKFVTLMAERFAKQRLMAMARLEGHATTGGVPVVLFLCVHNAGRSQMALGWLEQLAHGRAVAWSGGSDPTSAMNPAAVQAMAEVGIDISGEFPKPWTDEIVKSADVVVTMGCADACPNFPGKSYQDWKVPDPAGQPLESVRPIRDQIGQQVRALLRQLHVPVA
jgi:protein-tyrosine-phosphatase